MKLEIIIQVPKINRKSHNTYLNIIFKNPKMQGYNILSINVGLYFSNISTKKKLNLDYSIFSNEKTYVTCSEIGKSTKNPRDAFDEDICIDHSKLSYIDLVILINFLNLQLKNNKDLDSTDVDCINLFLSTLELYENNN